MQLFDTLSDIHPDKLCGVIDSHIKNGRANEIRQALPALIEQHPELNDELEQIRHTLKQEYSEEPHTDSGSPDKKPKPAIELISSANASIYSCINCGGLVTRQHSDSVVVICQYCGSDAKDATPKKLSDWSYQLHTDSDFTIGSFFTRHGVRWQAIGVQRYTGTLWEWDDEDDEWAHYPVGYTVWWMLNKKREMAWLSDFGSDRYWSEKHIPEKTPSGIPTTRNKRIEYGEYTLAFAAGEFTYNPNYEELRKTYEYLDVPPYATNKSDQHGEKYAYTVEVAHYKESDKTKKEIEYIRSVEVSDIDILRGIRASKNLSELKRWYKTAAAFFAGALLVIVSYFYVVFDFVPQRVWNKTIPVAQENQSQIASLEVKVPGEVYALDASLVSKLPANSFFEVDVEVTDSTGEYAGGYYHEFWHETGRDSDGPWAEHRSRFSRNLRFDEPGVYTFSAVAGEVSGRTSSAINFTLTRNPMSGSGFFGSFILALLLGFLALIFVSKLGEKRASITAKSSKITTGRLRKSKAS